MRKHICISSRLFIGIVAVISALCAIPAHALEMMTEDNAPFNYLDNNQRVAGISTEIVLEMGRRTAIPIKITLTPWARAYQMAQYSVDTCVYSTTRLPEREPLFKWIGPIATNKWALFARSDFNNKEIENVEDARNYRIGGVIMDAKAMYLKSLGFTNLDLVSDDNLNLVKLTSGRIDLWISGLYRGKELMSYVGTKKVKPVLIVREVDYYIACNLKTPDTIIAALTKELQALQKDGYVKAVIDRYAGRLQ